MSRLLLGPVLALSLLIAPGVAGSVGAAPAEARSAAASRAERPVYGAVRAPDQRLRTQACHRYRYTYRVDVPTDAWLMEATLRNPNGRAVGSAYISSQTEPRTGTRTFKVCPTSTRAGLHKIRFQVSYDDGRDRVEGRRAGESFRLYRR